LGEMVLDRSGKMSCQKDNIILVLLLGDGDVGVAVVDVLLGSAPVSQQLSKLNNLLEMVRLAPTPGEELGEEDRPVEVVQPALHLLQGNTDTLDCEDRP